MDNYIVSARKYRPTTFESVVGQQSLTQTLRNAIASNRLAHAYLFCGPRGVGKTTCARIFAKTINCLQPTPEHEACNQCQSCSAFNEQHSFNIHELDAASNNSVEDIRNLTEQVRIPPQIGRYSVYIIDEVHMLSNAAFNALLKTLEEPPAHAIFILATTEKHKIIPTILSRCQVYDFTRITVTDTIRHLQYVAQTEGINASEEALNVVAQKADGGMRDALSIFDQLVAFCGDNITYEQAIAVLNVLNSEYYFSIIDAALQAQVPQVLLTLNEVLLKGFDAGNFINGLAQHLRDLLVCKDAATAPLLETSDAIRQRYVGQAARCNAKWLFLALDVINTCDINYRTAKNKRLTVELALIKLCRLMDTPATLSTPAPTAAPARAVTPAPTAPVATAPRPMATTTTATTTATAAPKATAAPPPMEDMPSLSRLGDLAAMGRLGSTPAAATTKTPEEPQQALRNNPFTQDQLSDAWAGLAIHFPKEERLASILAMNEPVLVAPDLCVLTLSNPWQKEEFATFGKQIMTIVRDRLKNDLLKLQVEVKAHHSQRRAYTASEKYKVLEKMNPHIAELRAKMHLQLE